MEHTPEQVSAFRYWIQGYQNFYEPIVGEYFRLAGYHVLRRPAVVGRADIQQVIDAVFDGRKRLGPELDRESILQRLRRRKRLQPDLLLERAGRRYLAELKSWGGYRSGVFDLSTATAEFIANPDRSAFFLIDTLEGIPIAGKLLVVSARSPEHDQVLNLLKRAYQTEVELLYLDELFRAPQLAGIIDRQLRYLDAAVAELKLTLCQPGQADC